MNWKNRFTNYNFWISIVSAVLLILQAFEFQFDIMYINEIATAVLGLLVVIGIINDPTKTSVKMENDVAKKENKKETKKEIPLNNEDVKVEEINENINVESEEKIVDENLNTAEQMEENFPIAEQGKIDAEHNENDFENLIETISLDLSEGENNFQEMFKNLLNLLKNNEKTSEKSEILQNFPKNEEVLTEIKSAEIFEDSKEIVKENNTETKKEEEQIAELPNNESIKEEEKQTEISASSFNIVN